MVKLKRNKYEKQNVLHQTAFNTTRMSEYSAFCFALFSRALYQKDPSNLYVLIDIYICIWRHKGDHFSSE